MKKVLVLLAALLILTACGKKDAVLPEIEAETTEIVAVSTETPEPEADIGPNADFLAKHPIGKLEGLTFSAQLEEDTLLMTLDTDYDVTVEGAYLCQQDTALWYALDWTAIDANTLEADCPEELTDGLYYPVLDVKVSDEGLALATFLIMGHYETPSPLMDWGTALYIGDAVYELEYDGNQLKTAIPGEAIGACQWDIADHRPKVEVPDYVEISSTNVPWGETIYQQEGYDPSFRICARIERGGEIYSFRRRADEAFLQSLDSREMSPGDLYGDISHRVERITITRYFGDMVVGELEGDKAQEFAASFLSCTYDESAREEYETDDQVQNFCLIKFELEDGTIEEARMTESGACRMVGYFWLREDILAQLREAVTYSAACIPNNAQSRGTLVSDMLDQQESYTQEDNSWKYLRMAAQLDTVENNILYYELRANLDIRCALEPEPVTSVQGYKQYIYYLNDSGAVKRLWREDMEEVDFMLTVEKDGIESHISTETVDPGPYTKLRIVGESFYTLDASGTLKADGEVIAENVTEFEPDYDGVCYIDDSGLWRLKNGKLTCIAQGDIDCFAFAAAKIFYCTGGELMKFRFSDGKTEDLGRINAHRMVWTTVDHEECLITIDEDGCLTARFLDGNRRSFVIAETGVEVMGLEDNYNLVAGGSEEMYYVDLGRLREQNDIDDWTPGDLGEYAVSTRSKKIAKMERELWCSKVRAYNGYETTDIIEHSNAKSFTRSSYGYTAIEKLAELLDITSSEADCRWTISETDLGWLLEHPDGTAYELDIESGELVSSK